MMEGQGKNPTGTPVLRPRIRLVEARPVTINSQDLVCITDPENPGGNPLFVTPPATFIIALFDGTRSTANCAKAFEERFGTPVAIPEIESLIAQLDEYYFLDNERSRAHREYVSQRFRESTEREPSHAGLTYPEEPLELRASLDSYFETARVSHPPAAPGQHDNAMSVKAIISPHLDYPRGGHSYAIVYRELAGLTEDTEPLTVVILGTSHYATCDNPFIVTRKTFKTPLGEARVDEGFLDELTRGLAWDTTDGEIAHLNEHSIELQVVFLQHVLGNSRPWRIVPILCNSFHEMVTEGASPTDDPRVSEFITRLARLTTGHSNRVLTVVSADMAHMGLKFGDPEPVDDSTLSWIRDRDGVSLRHTERVDAEGFYRSIEEEKDKRKVCGLSPIYCLLASTDATHGRLLHYDHALEPEVGSVVSYASLALWG